MQHRTKNMLSVLQVVINRTLFEGKTISGMKKELEGRVQAIARAYAMLAGASWKGARLAQIIEEELAAFPSRVSIRGCDLVVDAAAAQQFALIIHELAANAAKYGALSTTAGRILITGEDRASSANTFVFRWEESGGPPVAPPTHTGFGSALLIDAARQSATRVAADYDSEGFRYELDMPLTAIETGLASERIA